MQLPRLGEVEPIQRARPLFVIAHTAERDAEGKAVDAPTRLFARWGRGCQSVYLRAYERKLRKQVRTSSMYEAGCSKAAKWPPTSNSFQWMMFGNRFSAQRRELRKIS